MDDTFSFHLDALQSDPPPPPPPPPLDVVLGWLREYLAVPIFGLRIWWRSVLRCLCLGSNFDRTSDFGVRDITWSILRDGR